MHQSQVLRDGQRNFWLTLREGEKHSPHLVMSREWDTGRAMEAFGTPPLSLMSMVSRLGGSHRCSQRKDRDQGVREGVLTASSTGKHNSHPRT